MASGGTSLNRSDKSRVDLVRTTAEDEGALLDAAGVRMDVSLPASPLWVNCDPVRIAQIIVNLLGNAAKFTDRGGLLTLSLRRDDTGLWAALGLRDNGIGIEPEMLSRLFQPFSQADAGDVRTRGGLGLGLSVVRGLVTAHGGTVEARNDGRRRGAEFTVRLPLLDRTPDAASGSPTAVTAGPGAPRHRIMVVEDCWDFSSNLRVVLEVAGHEVDVAADREQD